jgi:hypothetical protein
MFSTGRYLHFVEVGSVRSMLLGVVERNTLREVD